MKFTLQLSKVFIIVIQNKGITKAPEKLDMIEPPVSIQIKNLQVQFDIASTEIVGRKLYVTEFGRELCQIADRILKEITGSGRRVIMQRCFQKANVVSHVKLKLTFSEALKQAVMAWRGFSIQSIFVLKMS